MKMSTRTVVKLVIWLMIGLIVLGFVIVWQLDKLVATGIRTFGSRMTGTEVAVSDVSIGLFSGEIKLTGFKVGNPPGFYSDSAVKVGKFHMKAALSTLTKPKTVIEYMELSDVYLDYEYRLSEGSNLNVIQKNIEAFVGGGKKSNAPAKKDDSKSSDKQVVIKKLVLRNVTVAVSSKALHSSLKVTLPTIEMTNLGEKQNIAEVSAEVIGRILTEIAKLVDLQQLSQSLEDLGRKTLEKIDKATSTVGGVVVQAGDIAGGAVEDAVSRSKQLIKVVPGVGF